MKPGMGTMDNFLCQRDHFLTGRSAFRRKTDTLCCCSGPNHMRVCVQTVTILAKTLRICCCRPVLQYLKFNINLLGRSMKPVIGIKDKFLLQPLHFLPSQSLFWRNTDKFCCCSGPKHMCLWLQTTNILFELQHYSIMKIHESWDGKPCWVSTPTSSFCIKLASVLRAN